MNSPTWLEKAKANYRTDASRNTTLLTDISRGMDAVVELKDFLRDELQSKPKIDLLLVGAGYNGATGISGVKVLCPYEAYNIAASLESQSIDYTMTIVDLDERALENLRNRRRIFVPHAFIRDAEGEYDPRMNYRRAAWNEYLQMTRQMDGIAYYPLDGLSTEPAHSLDELLREGVHHAQIPKKFREKLESGQIKTMNSDIAQTEFQETYDFIICNNVLYMLPKEGQQLAINNLVGALNTPGVIHICDPVKERSESFSPIHARDKGWLSKKILKNLGVKAYDTRNLSTRARSFILVKS